MPTTIDSAGITFNDASTITSANTFIAKPASPSNGQVLSYNGSTWTGAALSDSPAAAKAWFEYDAVANVLQNDYGISGVTRTATGRFTATFDTPAPNIYYCVVTGGSDQKLETTTRTVNDFNITSLTGTTYNNPTYVDIAVFY
jgi:hypothetical protein